MTFRVDEQFVVHVLCAALFSAVVILLLSIKLSELKQIKQEQWMEKYW